MSLLTGQNCVRMLAGCALAAATITGSVQAQSQNDSRMAETKVAPETTETIYLVNATGINDLNDVQTALRNSFTRERIYGVPGQYAITIRGSAEDVAGSKKLVADLDRPRKTYRVTYTFHESENGKPAATHRCSMIVASGGKTMLKQGNRVPLVTGTMEGANAAQNSQVQYIDAGLNIEANIEGMGLHTKVEESSIADEKSGIGAQDPVIRQTMVEGLINLDTRKPVLLGSVDIPGSTRHEEIEVSVEPLAQ